MKLLRDADLKQAITDPVNPIMRNLVQPPQLPDPPAGHAPIDPWLGKRSMIQPCSVDLHVGAVYLPEAQNGAPGSATNPKTEHVLNFGHTAVVATLEELALPTNVAGFGFPPSKVAFGGLLMINPGHVDPGFSGQLRFTVINVGKQPIRLKQEEPIFTLLLLELDEHVTRGFDERRGDIVERTQRTVEQRLNADLEKLSLNFLDVESRSTNAARDAVSKAGFRGPLWTAVIGGLLTLIAAIATGFFGIWQPTKEINRKIDELNKIVGIHERKSAFDEIDQLRKEMNEIKHQFQPRAADSVTTSTNATKPSVNSTDDKTQIKDVR